MFTFFAETTVHGLNHIEKGKHRIHQVFWVVAFLAAFTAASVLFSYQIDELLHHPIGSEYQIKQLPMYIRLPKISICTNFPLSRTKLTTLNISEELGMVLNSAYEVLPPSPSQLKATYLEYVDLMRSLKTSAFGKVLKAVSVQCDNLLQASSITTMMVHHSSFKERLELKPAGTISRFWESTVAFSSKVLLQKQHQPYYDVYFALRKTREDERFTPTQVTGGDSLVLILGDADRSGERVLVPNHGYTEISIKLIKITFLHDPPHHI